MVGYSWGGHFSVVMEEILCVECDRSGLLLFFTPSASMYSISRDTEQEVHMPFMISEWTFAA